MSETDGIGEAVEQEIRAAVMAAAQIAEHTARRAETRTRRAERDTAASAVHTQARRTAERDVARAFVAPTRDPRWWDTTTLGDAAHAYATAHTWAAHDPQLAADAIRIAERIEKRYGADSAALVVDAARTGRNTLNLPGQDVDDAGPRRRSRAEQQYAAVSARNVRAVTVEM